MFAGCGGKQVDENNDDTTKEPVKDDSEATPDENEPVEDAESSDDALVSMVSQELHDKIIGAVTNKVIVIIEGKPFSIGLVYTRDENEKGDDSYAFFLAEKILNKLTHFADACYKVMPTDEERKKLIEKSGEQLDDVFDNNSSITELGKQIVCNYGLFVQVKAVNGKEELTIKLFAIATGELFYGNEHKYESDYLKYIKQAEEAEANGNMEEAASYAEMASAERSGHDPYSRKKSIKFRKNLPPKTIDAIKTVGKIKLGVDDIHKKLSILVKKKIWRLKEFETSLKRLKAYKNTIEAEQKKLGIKGRRGCEEIIIHIDRLIKGCEYITRTLKNHKKPVKFKGF